MIRSDVLKTLIPLISARLVVTNIGLPSQEMHLLDDQPTNFYMLGTMGLASSIGLGPVSYTHLRAHGPGQAPARLSLIHI